jgi:hypothetical protein
MCIKVFLAMRQLSGFRRRLPFPLCKEMYFEPPRGPAKLFLEKYLFQV